MQRATDLNAFLVVWRIDFSAGRTEYGDRTGNLSKSTKTFDELTLDMQDPPWIGVQPVRILLNVQKALVGGGSCVSVVVRFTTAIAKHHRAAEPQMASIIVLPAHHARCLPPHRAVLPVTYSSDKP